MTAALKARVARLEAKRHKDASRVVGVIGGLPETYVEEVDGVLYLRRPETPSGEAFAPWAARQQAELQRELIAIVGDDAPQAKAPTNVGIVNNPAPLKPGQKQPNFVHLRDGTEIKLQRN